jgi:hypothetical protein
MINYAEYLRASNGIGEAVRANVVVDRPTGSAEINVDTVLNWPSKFIATSGTLDISTGTFDPTTMTVFYGHLSGSYIEIDEFAPGYPDVGNLANQLIVVKPSTPWADQMATYITSVLGTVWYSGAGVPSTLHNVNDYYLNTLNGDVYIQTIGSWGSPIIRLKGSDGTNGLGVPAGGTTDQLLTKNSNADNDTSWKNAPVSLPSQTGANGKYLTTDGSAASWNTLPNLANQTYDELMSGTVNGTNKVFTTAANFTSILVFKNGSTMHVGDDYTVTGANQITFVTAPATTTKITCLYNTASTAMINGSNSLKSDEVPSGAVNGSTTLFTTSVAYIPNSLEYYVNGVKQIRGVHFTETNPSIGTFTASDAPLTGDVISTNYQFISSVSGNSDTLDGYHANATPTANTIPVLDSQTRLPDAIAKSLLGRSDRTSTMSGFATETDIVSVTVAVPTTTREINVRLFLPQVSSSVGTDRFTVKIYEGATVIQQCYGGATVGTQGWTGTIQVNKAAPTAGNYTYKASIARDSGTGTLTVYGTTGANPSIMQLSVRLE